MVDAGSAGLLVLAFETSRTDEGEVVIEPTVDSVPQSLLQPSYAGGSLTTFPERQLTSTKAKVTCRYGRPSQPCSTSYSPATETQLLRTGPRSMTGNLH